MANSLSAALPQFWANTALMQLMELTPAAQAVNKQFAPQLARAGDQVNAYRADRRVIRRKDGADANTEADANLTAVPVVLDQYFYDAFVITDEDESLSIAQLTELFLVEAVRTIARGVDRSILGRVHSFLREGSPEKRAGRLGAMTTANAETFILEAEEVLAGNLAPMEGLRTAIVHHTVNTKLMGTDVFMRADARGGSQTVATGEVGTVFNTRVIMSQNVNYVSAAGADTQSSTINNAPGYAAGEVGALTVVDPGTDWAPGEYVTIEGNDQPNWVASTASATSITLNEALKYDVADSAPIVHYLKVTNEAVERTAGYKKSMTFTHTSGKQLQQGQLISFGTSSRHTYTIIEVSATTATTSTVLLDRPLEATVASAAVAFPGPAGAMCPVLHRDAIAFVSRPMREKNKGAISAVANAGGIGVRVSMQDELASSGTRVVVDLLAGVSVLNEDLLCVLLA
jgi:hypothetical protein